MLSVFPVRLDVLRPTGMPAMVEDLREDRMLSNLDLGCAVRPGVLSPTSTSATMEVSQHQETSVRET